MNIHYPKNSVFFQVIWLPRSIKAFFSACHKLSKASLTGLTYDEQAALREFVVSYPDHLTEDMEGGQNATVSRYGVRDAGDEDGEHG